MFGYGTPQQPKSPYVPHVPHDTTVREVDHSVTNQLSEKHARALLQRQAAGGMASSNRNQQNVPNQRGDEGNYEEEDDEMAIEDEIDDFVIEEVDQGKEVSNSNSRSEENKGNAESRQLNQGSSSNGPGAAGASRDPANNRSSNIMLEGSVEGFKNKSKFKMGLEEEKVDARQKEQRAQPPNHRLLFGVPVIIEENSSSN
jgi:hypothetical protein